MGRSIQLMSWLQGKCLSNEQMQKPPMELLPQRRGKVDSREACREHKGGRGTSLGGFSSKRGWWASNTPPPNSASLAGVPLDLGPSGTGTWGGATPVQHLQSWMSDSPPPRPWSRGEWERKICTLEYFQWEHYDGEECLESRANRCDSGVGCMEGFLEEVMSTLLPKGLKRIWLGQVRKFWAGE